ncbi:hypothetical protein [Micromonospora avicenniae]|uniref:hypothetical protein n=1 Tax=Micromonospora avicenniae TaxID=1198245 RepID=UPI00342101AE
MTDRPALVQAVTRNPIAAEAESSEVVQGAPESSTGDAAGDSAPPPAVPALVRAPAEPSVSDDTTVIIKPAVSLSVRTPVVAASVSDDSTIVIKPVVSSVRTPVAAPTASDDTTIIITPAARRVDSPTMLMAVVPRLPPVFVDPTGRRRSRLRLVAYALGALGLAYTALVGASFAGASVSPGSILPFVESTEQPWQPPPIPAIIPDPTPTKSAPASEGATVTSDPTAQPSDGSSPAGDRGPLALGAAPGTEPHHG